MVKKKATFRKFDSSVTNVKQHTEPHFNTSSETSNSDINRTSQSLDSTRFEENLSDSLEAVTLEDYGNTISLNDNSLVDHESLSRSYSQNNQKQGGDYNRRSYSKYELAYPCINNLESIPEPIASNSEVLELQKEDISVEIFKVDAKTFVSNAIQVVPNRIHSYSYEFTHEDSGFPLNKQNDFDIPKKILKRKGDILGNEVSSAGATIPEWHVAPVSELNNAHLERGEHKRGNYNKDKRHLNKSTRDFSQQFDNQQHINDEVHVKSCASVANSSSNTSSYPEEGDLNRGDCTRNNYYKKGDSGAGNGHVKKSNNYSTKPHINKPEHNVLSDASTTNLSSNVTANDTSLYSEVDERRNDSEQRHGNESFKENYNCSSVGQMSSNQGMNNSFYQQSKKRFSDPDVKSYAGVANPSSNNTSSYLEEVNLNKDDYRSNNHYKQGDSGADNRQVKKIHITNYNQTSHINKQEHNVLRYASTTNLSSNVAHPLNRYGNKVFKENNYHSSDGKWSSNEGMNNSFRQQAKKKYSDPRFERDTQSRNFTFNPDEEYQQFLSCKQIKNEGFIKVIEEDLFAMPKDYALAHCVAEDMRMGSGISVQFKRNFKRVDELLQQNAREGGLATLYITTDNNGKRYIYYLVTKKLSNGKPTYDNFWSSLKEMRNHIRNNNVKKLAMPKIGCGWDRLEWYKVKQMIEFLFKDVDVDIIVCTQ